MSDQETFRERIERLKDSNFHRHCGHVRPSHSWQEAESVVCNDCYTLPLTGMLGCADRHDDVPDYIAEALAAAWLGFDQMSRTVAGLTVFTEAQQEHLLSVYENLVRCHGNLMADELRKLGAEA